MSKLGFRLAWSGWDQAYVDLIMINGCRTSAVMKLEVAICPMLSSQQAPASLRRIH